MAALTLFILLAGCSGTTTSNDAPHAVLEANKEIAWNGEQFMFNGEDSTDDGTITSWRFDFGDGTTYEAQREEDARVSHSYLRGGQFAVTMTVTDDGGEDEGALSNTDTLYVAVNEKQPVVGGPLYATPLNEAGNEYKQDFNVYESANRFEMNVSVASLLVTGSTEVTVMVKDPSGKVIDEETVTVQVNQQQTLTMQGALTEQGMHKIEIVAKSGGAQVDGELRVYYAESMP